MRILLINPPFFNSTITIGADSLTTAAHDFAPPLGLMYLKAYLRRESDFEVRMWNAHVPGTPGWEELESICRQYQPDLVGITVTFLSWFDALESARRTRKILPAAHIVLGGPHVTIFPEESLGQPEVDYVAIGEGEQTLLELARRLAGKESLQGLKGIWFKQDGTVIRNPPREVERHPDKYPFPDRSDFNPGQYRLTMDPTGPPLVMITSRGCPFRCTFCATLNKQYRARSPENVLEEILACKESGYRFVNFYDEIFNINKKRVMEICDAFLKNRVDLPWSAICRVDPMDDEMAEAMVRAGCTRLSFGIESAEPEILARIKKQISLDETLNAIRLCKKYGIDTTGYFLIGFPGETLEQARSTIKFALRCGVDFAIFNTLMPAPGSEIYDQAIRDPKFGGDRFREFACNPTKDFKMKVWETAVPETELHRLRNTAYLKFYFRPGYIWKSILKLSSWEDFKVKLKTALIIGYHLLTSLKPSRSATTAG